MNIVVTGAAGFIGSRLCTEALRRGDTVTGVDCFTDYYEPWRKEAAVAPLVEHPRFRLVRLDLQGADDHDLADFLTGADVVYHLAGQPGVRLSWSDGFDRYVGRNVSATQRLLEAARLARPARIVYASSSSVYGNAARYPTLETDVPQPHSPYGVTKLAAEHLCGLYAANWDMPTVALRYFTVYGPGQRPDMGFHRFLDAAGSGRPIPLYGDGEQVRDFTFVDDIVAATLAAGSAQLRPGTVLNVAGGGSTTVNALLQLLAGVVDREIVVENLPEQAGDVRRTGGSIEKAQRLLGWTPQTDLWTGLSAQWQWQQSLAAPALVAPGGSTS